jgi:hypothetical protein
MTGQAGMIEDEGLRMTVSVGLQRTVPLLCSGRARNDNVKAFIASSIV